MAHEKLVELHGVRWFEGRGPPCTLLVYVDDATGRIMELRFVVTESAFDCFEATVSYIQRHGRPIALYSDKHSIFRVHHEGSTGRSGGVSQFARALADLNIDIRFEGKTLPYDVLDKQPLVDAGALVEHKRLGAVLSIIQATQAERDEQRLASRKMTLREKARLRESRDLASAPPLPAPLSRDQRLTAMASFTKHALEEQAARRKANNDRSNKRKRDRELELAKRRHSTLDRE